MAARPTHTCYILEVPPRSPDAHTRRAFHAGVRDKFWWLARLHSFGRPESRNGVKRRLGRTRSSDRNKGCFVHVARQLFLSLLLYGGLSMVSLPPGVARLCDAEWAARTSNFHCTEDRTT